jgi:hypothetical protein
VESPCGSWWDPKARLCCASAHSLLRVRTPADPSFLRKRSRVLPPVRAHQIPTLNIIWSCGLFEGKGVSTSRVSPPGPLSIS